MPREGHLVQFDWRSNVLEGLGAEARERQFELVLDLVVDLSA